MIGAITRRSKPKAGPVVVRSEYQANEPARRLCYLEDMLLSAGGLDQRLDLDSPAFETEGRLEPRQRFIDRAHFVRAFDLRVDQAIKLVARSGVYRSYIRIRGIKLGPPRTEETQPRSPIQFVEGSNDIRSTFLEQRS